MTKGKLVEPLTISRLPLDRRGRRVPWFIDWNGGQPDFRVVRVGAVRTALRKGLCWVCGTHRGGETAFVMTGPISVVNRIAPEPPCHTGCAIYTVKACPFLTTPQMRRRETGLPEDRIEPGDSAILNNAGVAAVWVGDTWSIDHDAQGGILMGLGTPRAIRWYCQGRRATLDEVTTALNAGLPQAFKWAEAEGLDQVAALGTRVAQLMPYLPVEPA